VSREPHHETGLKFPAAQVGPTAHESHTRPHPSADHRQEDCDLVVFSVKAGKPKSAEKRRRSTPRALTNEACAVRDGRAYYDNCTFATERNQLLNLRDDRPHPFADFRGVDPSRQAQIPLTVRGPAALSTRDTGWHPNDEAPVHLPPRSCLISTRHPSVTPSLHTAPFASSPSSEEQTTLWTVSGNCRNRARFVFTSRPRRNRPSLPFRASDSGHRHIARHCQELAIRLNLKGIGAPPAFVLWYLWLCSGASTNPRGSPACRIREMPVLGSTTET